MTVVVFEENKSVANYFCEPMFSMEQNDSRYFQISLALKKPSMLILEHEMMMNKREKPKRLKRAQHWLCNAQKKFEKCKHNVSDAALRIT